MGLLIVACLIIAFVAGVAESTRVINAVDRAAAELHLRIKAMHDRISALEDAVKGKL